MIAGLFLYWHDWHLFQSFGDWLGSRFGASLTIGMVSALIALAIGGSITRPNVRRIARARGAGGGVGRAAHARCGRRARDDPAAAEGLLTRRLGFLLFAVVAMSVARYL